MYTFINAAKLDVQLKHIGYEMHFKFVNWANQHRSLLVKKRGHWNITDRCQFWMVRGQYVAKPLEAKCVYINHSFSRWKFNVEYISLFPLCIYYRQANYGNEHALAYKMDIRKILYNISINICLIKLKWDGKKLKYGMITR